MSQNVMSLEEQTLNSAAATLSTPPLPPGESPVFSEQEWQALQDEDYGAARIIVGIIGSVVSAGLALYAFIACLVAMGGH